jgi:hypothetical protein
VHIHGPIAAIISKLDILDRRSPVATRNFVNELWNNLPNNSIYMEMLSQVAETGGRTYPLLNYLLDSIWFPWEEHANALNRKPHSLIVDFFYTRRRMRSAFGDYVCDRLFPRVESFLVAVCGYAETIQFRGAVTEMTEFCDEIFRSTRAFPIMEVVRAVPEPKLLLAAAFLLSHFTEKRVVDALLAFCLGPEFLRRLAQALGESTELRAQALVVVRSLLSFPSQIGPLLPPESHDRVDIAGLLPFAWGVRMSGEGTQHLSAYVADARARIEACGVHRRLNVGDCGVFGSLVRLLGQYQELSLRMAFDVTNLVGLFVAMAPDLVNGELARAVRVVVERFDGVEVGELPTFDSPDTPQLRAALFLEFVKEILATVLAAQEIAAVGQSYCDEM